MMMHAYAPGKNHPPMLFVRWTWHREMGVPWEKCGIADSEVPHLASLVNIKNQADGLRSRGKKGKGSPHPGMGPPTI